jgi:hypothetical protein
MSFAGPEIGSRLDWTRGKLAALRLGLGVLALLLRLGAMRTEFWFDETWSWEFARAAGSPWQVFVGANQHHDNNHKLNTLYLWFCSEGFSWWWYRLHSLLAGLTSVALAVLVARRRGRVEAIFAALLFASNYWLVLCSAEARGYALAVCFSLLAFYTLQGYLTSGSRWMLFLFWISVILGFSSHLTFIHCYLALALWSVFYLARQRLSTRQEIQQIVVCHAVPALFFVALYLVDIRRMGFGGGPPMPTLDVIGRLLSLGLGGPSSGVLLLPLTVFAAVVFGIGLRLLARDSLKDWLFYLVAIVGSPALFLLGKPAYLFERYFLISFVFFLMLLSYVLATLWRRSRTGAFAAGVVVVGIVAGNLWQIARFAQADRGHFLDALAWVELEAPEGNIAVSGDYDFRVHKMYAFYYPYLPNRERFVYHEQAELPAHGAEWLLVHRLDDRHTPEQRMYDSLGNAYQRVHDFPAAAFGCWSWYVYRNEGGESKNPSVASRRGNGVRSIRRKTR